MPDGVGGGITPPYPDLPTYDTPPTRKVRNVMNISERKGFAKNFHSRLRDEFLTVEAFESLIASRKLTQPQPL